MTPQLLPVLLTRRQIALLCDLLTHQDDQKGPIADAALVRLCQALGHPPRSDGADDDR